MKKQNNKGFTLVELVIVIAVIVILAGVLIGTFAGIISRANQSKALQVAKVAFDEKWVEFVAVEHEIPTWIIVDAGVVTLYNDKNTFTTGKGNYRASISYTRNGQSYTASYLGSTLESVQAIATYISENYPTGYDAEGITIVYQQKVNN